MNTFEQVLNKFEQVWTHLNNFEHIWTHLTNFEHIWTHLNSTCFDPFLELINLFLYICIFVSHVSDVSYVPREGAYICPLGSTSHFRYSDLPPTKIWKRCPTGSGERTSWLRAAYGFFQSLSLSFHILQPIDQRRWISFPRHTLKAHPAWIPPLCWTETVLLIQYHLSTC